MNEGHTVNESHTDSPVIKGECLAPSQQDSNREYGSDYKMEYKLTPDGVLTVSGNTWILPQPSTDAQPYYDEPVGPPYGWSEYESQFKHLNFHTLVIDEGVVGIGETSFKDCKNLKRLILPEKVPTIRKSFADGTPLEYTIKDGLKFLGPPSNPLYYLMGATDDFKDEILKIPEGTVRIADEAFKDMAFIKHLEFPSTLEHLGWYTFDGTSVKELFLKEGKLAYDETLLAFDGDPGAPLEVVSLPFSMYEIYKNGEDCGLVEAWNRTCRIIYRNSDDSVAEIIEPHALETNFPESCDMDLPEQNSDELPF